MIKSRHPVQLRLSIKRRKAVRDLLADGFPVNCLDCPEPGVSVVCRSNKKRTKQSHVWTEHPNIFGYQSSGLRTQPPHCDKNSYFFDHLLSSVTVILNDNSRGVKNSFCTLRCCGRCRGAAEGEATVNIDRVRMLDAEEVSQLAIVRAIV